MTSFKPSADSTQQQIHLSLHLSSSLCVISELNLKKMDDEQNQELKKEEEKAIKLVKSASKNLKDVKKSVLRKEKEAEKALQKVKKEGLEEVEKAKLNLQSASAYKSALKFRKRALGLVPKPEKVGFFF